eukprot:GHVH01007041.1.p1 GENE.GHVH01007041.1~~GHVH01007041.1.p1  ORF type:complete len:389 (+),score=51.57 GHVH01007041.1:321-1487(+)
MMPESSNEPVCSCSTMLHSGLEGVVVAETRVSTVGIPKVGLTYRGYPVPQLIEHSSYEEVAYILINEKRPNAEELKNWKGLIAQGRILSLRMRSLLELFTSHTHPMDVIRTGVSYYGSEDEHPGDKSHLMERAGRLMGLLPSIVCYWYNFCTYGRRVDTVMSSDVCVAKHFLTCLNQKAPSELSVASMNKTLIGYAEHDLNASTFSGMVTASTLADYYSCIVSAIGTLKGPLHGGANQAALELLMSFENEKVVPDQLAGMLERKEKIMGFGHRVYKNGDPRHFVMKDLAKKLATCEQTANQDVKLFAIAEVLETEMIARKNIHPNLDFFAAVVYHMLGIPKELYTVLFAIGRTAGWTSHIQEQWENNKLIRPKSRYVGAEVRDFVVER